MRITVIGSGGVGGYFAAALIDIGHHVQVLTTPRHVQPLRTAGVRLDAAYVSRHADLPGEPLIPALVTADIGELQPADLVIVCLKLFQLRAMSTDLALRWRDLVADGGVIMGLQNGVEAPRWLAQGFGAQRVLPALTKIIAFSDGPGSVRQLGQQPNLTLARATMDDQPCQIAQRLASSFRHAKRPWATVTVTDDIWRELWLKYALITTFAAVCGMADATIGQVRDYQPTRELLLRGLQEVAQVAATRGVELDEDDVCGVLGHFQRAAHNGTCSIQRDIKAGRPSELEYLNGRLVDLARRAGLPLPLHSAAYAVLSLRARQAGEA